MKHLIVIDDSGSPGNFDETRFVKEDRKTLVGVFIHSELRNFIDKIIKGVVDILNQKFSITELHFTDLINRKNKWSACDIEDVLYIIETLSDVFEELDLPFIVQTCHSNTFKENGILISGRPIIDNFKMDKVEDQTLFLFLLRIKEFIKSKYPEELVDIVMDEGRKSKNKSEQFNLLKGFATNGEIQYKSSNEYNALQVADFFAYSVNRIQRSLIKENKTEFDKDILYHLNRALVVQQAIGVRMIEVDLDNFTKDDYDYEQLAQRLKDGNLDRWRNAQ